MTEGVKNETKRIKPLPIILVLAFLGLAGFGGWSFYSYKQAKEEVLRLSTLEGQLGLQKREVDELLSAVAKHLVLPNDEEPTIATISDIDVLGENQPFFDGASNGDKVIVYVSAGKAIIYSPDRDVIINVGAVIVDDNEVDVTDLSEDAEENGEVEENIDEE